MKNYKLFSILIIFLPIVSFSQTQGKIPWPSLADTPWPIGRGDAQATGRSEYVGPKTPNIIWKKNFSFGLLNSPVIGPNSNLLIGTRAWNSWDVVENYFYCADSAGNIIWTYTTDSFLANNSAPAVAVDGTIYFGSQSGAFYALDQNGNLKWKFQSSLNLYQPNNILDKDGNIYTTSTDSLFCFTPEGELKFRFGIGKIGGHPAFSPAGNVIYIQISIQENSKWFSYLYALNLDGEIIWEKKFSGLTKTTILVDNAGHIYVKGQEYNNPDIDYALICLNQDGTIKWHYEVGWGGHVGSATIDKYGNITFYAAIVVDDKGLYGLTSLDYDGNFRWFYNMEETGPPYYMPEEIQHGLVCDADGTIYAGSTWGYNLYAISKDGELLWKIPLDGMYADSSPVIGRDGTLYVGLHMGASENNLENTLIAIKDYPNSVKEENIPSEYKLEQNYPNPFNPSTTIKFSLPERSEVKLSIYNLLGQEIEILFQGEKEAGSYEYVFENKSISTGVYFYVLESQQARLSRKMMLIK